MSAPDTDKIMQRTYGYWYEDGLAETATGVLFVLLGLLFYAESAAGPGSALAGLSALGLPVLVVVGIVVFRTVVRALKERITYPRTGYVAYRRSSAGRRWGAAAVAALTGAVVAALFVSAPASLAWIPALDGIAIGVFWFFLGRKVGVSRFHVLALVSILAGGLASLSGLGDLVGSAAYFAAMGIATVVSGALALAAYLSATRPRAGG